MRPYCGTHDTPTFNYYSQHQFVVKVFTFASPLKQNVKGATTPSAGELDKKLFRTQTYYCMYFGHRIFVSKALALAKSRHCSQLRNIDFF